MSRIVVASLYKGFPENGGFNKEGAKLVRPNMKIMEDWVNEVNANFKHNGEFYVIDEEATQERLDSMNSGVDKKEPETDLDLEALKIEYKELSGVDPKGNWGVKKLTEEIEKLKN